MVIIELLFCVEYDRGYFISELDGRGNIDAIDKL